jgi:hypothetical protein
MNTHMADNEGGIEMTWQSGFCCILVAGYFTYRFINMFCGMTAKQSLQAKMTDYYVTDEMNKKE